MGTGRGIRPNSCILCLVLSFGHLPAHSDLPVFFTFDGDLQTPQTGITL